MTQLLVDDDTPRVCKHVLDDALTSPMRRRYLQLQKEERNDYKNR
ncbi:hypothetical protein [Prochlorococcus sp. MIT 0801]|nr:hypothetical protein [Prochlorococcus sp. MIT 0801]AIQ97595.1 hypothetical protein EW15_1503 [Prochlorococcus sp. MIT 0801]